MKYNEAMRSARKNRGITLEKLAKRSGVPLSTISKYERGLVIPGVYNLIDLADAIGISMDEYIGRRKPWQTSKNNVSNASTGKGVQVGTTVLPVNAVTTCYTQGSEELKLTVSASLLKNLLAQTNKETERVYIDLEVDWNG